MLRQLQPSGNGNVLVGTETADDAGVYRLNDDTAIVATVDYITPVVDDPFTYGQVAAANSLSDIWAMGARPLFALNLVGFPVGLLGPDVLAEIMRGGAAKATEAETPIIGGHTVRDDEPKYGLAVTGSVHPDRIIRNSGAQPGDLLFLTKPLGIGVITTAIKRDLASQALAAQAIKVMTTLNRGAAEAMLSIGVSAATDVTGFGLLGHLREMTVGSGVAAEIGAHAVPILPGVRELAADGVVPGGTGDNLAFLDGTEAVKWDPALDDVQRLILCDAQTSGGLLIAVPAARADALRASLEAKGTLVAACIGRLTAPDPQGRIDVTS